MNIILVIIPMACTVVSPDSQDDEGVVVTMLAVFTVAMIQGLGFRV